MSSQETAAARAAALSASDHQVQRLQIIQQAVNDARGRERGDPEDPLEQRRQVMRVASLMCDLYGSDAVAQARKVALRFGNGTFARQVVATVEHLRRAEQAAPELLRKSC